MPVGMTTETSFTRFPNPNDKLCDTFAGVRFAAAAGGEGSLQLHLRDRRAGLPGHVRTPLII